MAKGSVWSANRVPGAGEHHGVAQQQIPAVLGPRRAQGVSFTAAVGIVHRECGCKGSFVQPAEEAASVQLLQCGFSTGIAAVRHLRPPTLAEPLTAAEVILHRGLQL